MSFTDCTFFTTVCFISSSKVCLFSELVNLKREKVIKVAKNIHLSVNIIVSKRRLNPNVSVASLNQNTKTYQSLLWWTTKVITYKSRGEPSLWNRIWDLGWFQKMFGPFTVWINLAKSRPSASNFKSFSRSLEQFFYSRSDQFW